MKQNNNIQRNLILSSVFDYCFMKNVLLAVLSLLKMHFKKKERKQKNNIKANGNKININKTPVNIDNTLVLKYQS